MANQLIPPETKEIWPLQDAKARFSEVVKRAVEQGPQHVSVRGQPTVVVLSEKTFTELTALRPSIVDHILDGSVWPDDLVEAVNAARRTPAATSISDVFGRYKCHFGSPGEATAAARNWLRSVDPATVT